MMCEFCEQLWLFNFLRFFTLSYTVADSALNAVAVLTGGVVCFIHSP